MRSKNTIDWRPPEIRPKIANGMKPFSIFLGILHENILPGAHVLRADFGNGISIHSILENNGENSENGFVPVGPND